MIVWDMVLGRKKIAEYNEQAAKLGYTPQDFGASAWDDISSIARYQKSLQLVPDGWIGPATLKAKELADAFAKKGIIVDRHTYRLDKAYRRTKQVTSIVWHDSVTRTESSCHSVLEVRGLSTHFMIPEAAEKRIIYQCVEPVSMWAVHAGSFNQDSIGIDMINLLDPTLLSTDVKDAARHNRVVSKPWSGSKTKKIIDYTEGQKKLLAEVAAVLHEVFNIPKIVPYPLTGYGSSLKVPETFTGSIAHAQISKTRWDGLRVIEILIENGWQTKTSEKA